ncbi:MAG: hypothetical protein WHS65_05120 [Melioribacteraceae bacterium]
MKNLVKLILINVFLFNLLYSQTLSEEAKQKLLNRINEDTYDSVIDSIREYKVVEAIPLLEQYFFRQNSEYNRKYFLIALYELGSPNVKNIAKEYIDSIRIGKQKRNMYGVEISGAMKAFEILFQFSNYDYVGLYFDYLNKLSMEYPYNLWSVHFVPPLLELAKKEEYKERVKPYFEKIIKSGFDPLKIGPYIEKYQEIYKDTNLTLVLDVAANDTSRIVRDYVIGRILKKYKNKQVLDFYKERVDKENYDLTKEVIIWRILRYYSSPENYNFIKNRYNTFSEEVKKTLINLGFLDYKPKKPDSTETPLTMIDSLISYNNQCYNLGWIQYYWVRDINYYQLNNAKMMIQMGYPASAEIILQAYENWINTVKSLAWINEDAYRFLYYYSVYLRERLKV